MPFTRGQADVVGADTGREETEDPGDPVTKPAHYTRLNPEPIDVIDAWGLGFYEAQVLKYISRAGYKDPAKHVEDLMKAAFYLHRRIQRLQNGRS